MKTNYLDTVDNARLRANNEEEDIIYDDSRKSSFDKNATSIKDVILPSGIDATSYNHLEIFAKTTKYCRSFYVSSVCSFQEKDKEFKYSNYSYCKTPFVDGKGVNCIFLRKNPKFSLLPQGLTSTTKFEDLFIKQD